MFRLILVSFAMVVLGGCRGPTFIDLGNGVGVPSESIDNYASAKGITRAEARVRLRVESDQQRIADHAKKYEISHEEAKKQLEHAGR